MEGSPEEKQELKDSAPVAKSPASPSSPGKKKKKYKKKGNWSSIQKDVKDAQEGKGSGAMKDMIMAERKKTFGSNLANAWNNLWSSFGWKKPEKVASGISLKTLDPKTRAALEGFDLDKSGFVDANWIRQAAHTMVEGKNFARLLMKLSCVLMVLLAFSIVSIGLLTFYIVDSSKDTELEGDIMVNRATGSLLAIDSAIFNVSESGEMKSKGGGGGIKSGEYLQPTPLDSRLPDSFWTEFKRFSVNGDSGAFLSMMVQAAARYPRAGSRHGTVIVIFTFIGDITLDGTDMTFKERVAGAFEDAGFELEPSRRRLMGVTELVGFFNLMQDMMDQGLIDEMPAAMLDFMNGEWRVVTRTIETCHWTQCFEGLWDPDSFPETNITHIKPGYPVTDEQLAIAQLPAAHVNYTGDLEWIDTITTMADGPYEGLRVFEYEEHSYGKDKDLLHSIFHYSPYPGQYLHKVYNKTRTFEFQSWTSTYDQQFYRFYCEYKDESVLEDKVKKQSSDEVPDASGFTVEKGAISEIDGVTTLLWTINQIIDQGPDKPKQRVKTLYYEDYVNARPYMIDQWANDLPWRTTKYLWSHQDEHDFDYDTDFTQPLPCVFTKKDLELNAGPIEIAFPPEIEEDPVMFVPEDDMWFKPLPVNGTVWDGSEFKIVNRTQVVYPPSPDSGNDADGSDLRRRVALGRRLLFDTEEGATDEVYDESVEDDDSDDEEHKRMHQEFYYGLKHSGFNDWGSVQFSKTQRVIPFKTKIPPLEPATEMFNPAIHRRQEVADDMSTDNMLHVEGLAEALGLDYKYDDEDLMEPEGFSGGLRVTDENFSVGRDRSEDYKYPKVTRPGANVASSRTTSAKETFYAKMEDPEQGMQSFYAEDDEEINPVEHRKDPQGTKPAAIGARGHAVEKDIAKEGDSYMFVNKDGEYEDFSLAEGVNAVQFDLDRKKRMMMKAGTYDRYLQEVNRTPTRRLGNFNSWSIDLGVCAASFTLNVPFTDVPQYPYFKFQADSCVKGANFGGNKKVSSKTECAKKCYGHPRCQGAEYWISCSSGKHYCRMNSRKGTTGCAWGHCGDSRGFLVAKSPASMAASCSMSWGIVEVTGGFSYAMGEWPTGFIQMVASPSGGTIGKIIKRLPWPIDEVVDYILGGVSFSGRLEVTAKDWFGKHKKKWLYGSGGASLRIKGIVKLAVGLNLEIISASGSMGVVVTFYYLNKCTKKGKKGYLAINLDIFVQGDFCLWALTWWCFSKKLVFNLFPFGKAGQPNIGANDGNFSILFKPCSKCLPCNGGYNAAGLCTQGGRPTSTKSGLFGCG